MDLKANAKAIDRILFKKVFGQNVMRSSGAYQVKKT
jgi:hypothetical protein